MDGALSILWRQASPQRLPPGTFVEQNGWKAYSEGCACACARVGQRQGQRQGQVEDIDENFLWNVQSMWTAWTSSSRLSG
eukprot:5239549-Heterocapsa_arctica.AAC.1